MKKIPSLFERDMTTHLCTREINPLFHDLDFSRLEATVKWDGTSCLWAYGTLYKRYHLKDGRTLDPDAYSTFPDLWLDCEDLMPVHGISKPGLYWKRVLESRPEDVHHCKALESVNPREMRHKNTYELIGKGIQSNPYRLDKLLLKRHGDDRIPHFITSNNDLYEKCQMLLMQHPSLEGIVFWEFAHPFYLYTPSHPVCKIKQIDFGFAWSKRTIYEQSPLTNLHDYSVPE